MQEKKNYIKISGSSIYQYQGSAEGTLTEEKTLTPTKYKTEIGKGKIAF